MSKHATDIVAYLSPIGWLIAFVAGDREGSRFHLNQSLIIILAGIIIGLLDRLPLIGWLIGIVGGIFIFVLWVMGILSAIQDTEKEVPVLGTIHLLG